MALLENPKTGTEKKKNDMIKKKRSGRREKNLTGEKIWDEGNEKKMKKLPSRKKNPLFSISSNRTFCIW